MKDENTWKVRGDISYKYRVYLAFHRIDLFARNLKDLEKNIFCEAVLRKKTLGKDIERRGTRIK
jgi:hypothetical protein